MNGIPQLELPEFAASGERLAANIEVAREAISLRVGYEVELAGLETVQRGPHANVCLHWRPKQQHQFSREAA